MTADDGDGRHCQVMGPRTVGRWVKLCGCYADDCPQITIRTGDDGEEEAGIRNSGQPDLVVWFSLHEFREMCEAIRDPARDVLAEARETAAQAS